MNKNKSQLGSIHLAITIVLLVALLGALGFVFYQNFVLSKTSNPTPAVANSKTDDASKAVVSSEVALTEVASDTTGTGLSFKYPKTWTLSHETTPAGEVQGAHDSNIITSTDGKTTVILNIDRPSGLGVPCGGDQSTSVKVIDTGKINNYPSTGFIQYSEPNSGTFVGAYKLDVVQSKTDCMNYEKSQYILGYGHPANDPMGSVPIVKFQAKFTGNIDMNSDNYKIAKRIIQSLYKKD